MLIPYVREKLKEAASKDEVEAEVSPAGFLKFVMRAKDPNYSFMADCILELLNSIFVFRCGIRSGDVNQILAGRAKMSKLWFGRNHPLYRELDSHDWLTRERMPQELTKLVDRSLSLNMSGISYTGESPDFRLEELNKKVQHFIPPVPQHQDWQRICANFDRLESLLSKHENDKGIKKQQHERDAKDTSTEELPLRCLFRKNGYLLHPECQREHVSLSGVNLDSGLVLFCETARQVRVDFMKHVLEHERGASKPSSVSYTSAPVFILPKERDEHNKVEKLTIKQLIQMIEANLERLPDEGDRQAWQGLWFNDIKRSNLLKKDALEFHAELEEFMQGDKGDIDPGEL